METKPAFSPWIILFVVGVVAAVLATAALSRPANPWAWFENAQAQIEELPARIGEAHRAGDGDLEERLINRYNDSADLYNARMRDAMLVYGSPPPDFVMQYSHWLNRPMPPACCEGSLFGAGVAESADGLQSASPVSVWAEVVWGLAIIVIGILIYRHPRLIGLLLLSALITGVVGLVTRGPDQANTLRTIAVWLAVMVVIVMAAVAVRAGHNSPLPHSEEEQ